MFLQNIKQTKKLIIFSLVVFTVVIIFILSFYFNNFFNKIIDNKDIFSSSTQESQKKVDENVGQFNDGQTVNFNDYAYYYNQGFDAFGNVFIKISKKLLNEKEIGDYDKIIVNNLCYYPVLSDSFEKGRFTIADNCGSSVGENTVNKGQPYEAYLTEENLSFAREILSFVYDAQRVTQECESDSSDYYPEDLVYCNTNWNSWIFDHNLNFPLSYPSQPNYCLGISTSRAKSCFIEVDTCLETCRAEASVRDEIIRQQIIEYNERYAALSDNGDKASSCALSCTEDANLCCKKKFLSS